MNLRETRRYTQYAMMAGNAVTVLGPPGYGKTEMVNAVIHWYAAQNPGKRVGYSVTFLARQSEIGATGLPWKGQMEVGGKVYTITDPAVPRWYLAVDVATGELRPADQFDLVVVVFEEWGQGGPESKRAFADILRCGECDQWKLPEGSPRIALSNEDARDGVTKEFDFVIGRSNRLHVSGDVTIWTEDFADRPYTWAGKVWQVMPVTKAWAHNHQEIMFEGKPERQGPWCNPRSLTMWDRAAQVVAADNGGKMPFDDPAFTEMTEGYIGTPAMVSLCEHLQFEMKLPTLDDVEKDPDGTPIPKAADMQLLMVYKLAGQVDRDRLPNVIRYMDRKSGFPKDLSTTFIASLLRRDYNGFLREPAVQAWVSRNAATMAMVAALAKA